MDKVVTFGEIMLRLSTPGLKRFSQAKQFDVQFGGGEANVAVSLANYRHTGRLCYPLTAERYRPGLHDGIENAMALVLEQIVRGGERMGIYFLETGAVARASKVIYDRALFIHGYHSTRYDRLGQGF